MDAFFQIKKPKTLPAENAGDTMKMRLRDCMKTLLLPSILLISFVDVRAEEDTLSFFSRGDYFIEATLGADPAPRVHAGGLVKYRFQDYLILASHTDVGYSVQSTGIWVSIPHSDFQSMSLTATQSFGGGVLWERERYRHTFMLLGGVQYYQLSESHNYDHLESTTVNISAWLPDAGFKYGLAAGKGARYFTLRLYVPLLRIPDNILGITLSGGIGFRLGYEE